MGVGDARSERANGRRAADAPSCAAHGEPFLTPSSRAAGVLAIGACGLGLGLRVYALGSQSLWTDEVYSIHFAGDGLVACLERLGSDAHPPLYFALLSLWIDVFGESEIAVRSLSVVAGSGLVGAVLALGRRLLGAATGAVAALILATSLFHIYYAQEARGYALLALLSTLSTLFLVRWRSEGRVRDAAAYTILGAALLYTHYFGAFLLLAHNAFVAGALLRAWRRSGWTAEQRHTLFSWAAAQVAIAALFAPWVPVLLDQLTRVRSGFWIPESSVGDLGRTAGVFASWLRPPWGAAPLSSTSEIVAAAIFAVAAGLLWTRWLGITRSSRPASALTLLAVWLFVPVLAAWLVSQGSIEIYTIRNAIVSAPALAILFAAAVVRAPRRWLATTLLTLAIAPSLAQLDWLYHTPHKGPWRELADYLGPRLRPSDGAVFDEPAVRIAFDHYNRLGVSAYYAPIDIRRNEPPEVSRIWLVFAGPNRWYPNIPGKLRDWGYRSDSTRAFADVELRLYVLDESVP